MAAGAIRAGLPAELPVMAALPESELRNVPYGKDDSVGFFQMKLHIWNKGQYAGYLENPELQLKWFVDQALAVNASRIADGQAPYGADSSQWGDWVADVEVPGANIGQYQSHLDEAHGLIVLGCGLPAGSGFPAPAAADSKAPRLRLAGRRVQDPLRRGRIVIEAACPVEACVARAGGSIAGTRASKVHRIKSGARQIRRGGKVKLTLRVKPAARRAIRRALKERRRLRARVVVTATDASGNAAAKRRTITLTRRVAARGATLAGVAARPQLPQAVAHVLRAGRNRTGDADVQERLLDAVPARAAPHPPRPS